MKPQLSPEDLERLLTEETAQGDNHASVFMEEILGDEGAGRIVEWCMSWAVEALGPEEGSSVSIKTSDDLVAAMGALGLGLFELGWKAHLQYGQASTDS